MQERHPQQSNPGSPLHSDPAWSSNVMVIWEDGDERDGAYWLVIHPSHFIRNYSWLKNKKYLSKALTVKQMKEVKKHCGKKGAWCFKQEHGTLVTIPVGYCHAVTNVGPNMKVACDFMVEGGISLCMISYMYVWKKFEQLHVADYMGIAKIAMEKLKPTLHAQMRRMKTKSKEKERRNKKQKVRQN